MKRVALVALVLTLTVLFGCGPRAPVPLPSSGETAQEATQVETATATLTRLPAPTGTSPALTATQTQSPTAPPTSNSTYTSVGSYSGFYGFPDRFFQQSIITRDDVLKITDAQYLSLRKMHNGISPYGFCRIEYEASVYGSTTPYGIKLGEPAFPGLNSGHPRWEVMAHEQGHNFFGGTSAFYYSLAAPLPFLQESLAVVSAFYTYHDIIENKGSYGIDDTSIRSLDFDFANGRDYQQAMFNKYVSQGKRFDVNQVLTSQALDFKMITYGENYGWQNFQRLSKAFENGVSDRFAFHRDGVSPIEQSTYVIAALSVAFGRDFRQEFRDLDFPIDDFLYEELCKTIRSYIEGT